MITYAAKLIQIKEWPFIYCFVLHLHAIRSCGWFLWVLLAEHHFFFQIWVGDVFITVVANHHFACGIVDVLQVQ